MLWDNPTVSAYLIKEHEAFANSASAKAKRAGKKKAPTTTSESEVVAPEVVALKKALGEVRLGSWKVNETSSTFVRAPRNADYNTISEEKSSNGPVLITEGSNERHAVLTASIYSKVTWGPSYISRICQHAYLSCQTLQDVYDALPCVFKVPKNGAAHPESWCNGIQPGCVICVEDTLYPDRLDVGTDPDLAEQVLLQMRNTRKGGEGVVGMSKSRQVTAQVKLSSLSISLHKAYPIIHGGNCEHFLVFEQIRLRCHSDPLGGWPHVLQVTPPTPDLCRACRRVPAVCAVSGDIRLGESPCLLCGPCWDAMGTPSNIGNDSDGVTVVAIPVLPSVIS